MPSLPVTYGQPDQLTPAMADRIIECVETMLPDGFQASSQE